MRISELIDKVVTLLKLVAAKSPKNAVEAEFLTKELLHLKGWAYPQLTTEDITQVVRCKNCEHYRKYKKKGNRKSAPFYACRLNKIKRPADFYCAEGVKK